MLCRAVRREPSLISIRRTLATALAAGVFVLLGTRPLGAQEPAPQSHTVKRGDNLWDLAKLYLGDSFLWPEIYRLNTDIIDDPHWIYPGELLKLPEPGSTPTVAEAPTVKQAGEPAAPEPPVPTPAPAAAPVPAATGEPVYEPPTGVLDGPTVFPKQRVDVVAAKRRVVAKEPTPAVNLGSFLSAPFVDRSGGPRGAGAILSVTNLTASVSGNTPRERAQLDDELLIEPPVGSAAPEGERYVSYALGPRLEGFGQVIIPTGVVEVTRAPRDRDATTARVIKMFGEIFADQHLMPYDSTTLQFVARPQPTSDDSVVARVLLVAGNKLLPSLQDFLLVGASSQDGVKLGDEFELYVPRHGIDGSRGLHAPDANLARAQVVRVTRYGATLMITEHQHPQIEEGTFARRVATMP